jgi:hypothetical protein
LATLLLHHSIFPNHKTSTRPDRYRAVEAASTQNTRRMGKRWAPVLTGSEACAGGGVT